MGSKFNADNLDLLGSLTGLPNRVSEAVAEPKAEPVRAEQKPKAKNDHFSKPKQTATTKETKTKCFQLRLKPSQYEALEKRAEAEGRSINNLIEKFINDGLENN